MSQRAHPTHSEQELYGCLLTTSVVVLGCLQNLQVLIQTGHLH